MRTAILIAACAVAACASRLPDSQPAATIDLATTAGAQLARATWKYADAPVVPSQFRAPGQSRPAALIVRARMA